MLLKQLLSELIFLLLYLEDNLVNEICTIFFLHGYLEEKFYMRQPPRSEHQSCPDYNCKMNNALYGMKQAPRAWSTKLGKKLCALRFKGSEMNTYLFYYRKNDISMFILVYVDDIIIISSI